MEKFYLALLQTLAVTALGVLTRWSRKVAANFYANLKYEVARLEASELDKQAKAARVVALFAMWIPDKLEPASTQIVKGLIELALLAIRLCGDKPEQPAPLIVAAAQSAK
jgi:hypothetical protein